MPPGPPLGALTAARRGAGSARGPGRPSRPRPAGEGEGARGGGQHPTAPRAGAHTFPVPAPAMRGPRAWPWSVFPLTPAAQGLVFSPWPAGLEGPPAKPTHASAPGTRQAGATGHPQTTQPRNRRQHPINNLYAEATATAACQGGAAGESKSLAKGLGSRRWGRGM